MTHRDFATASYFVIAPGCSNVGSKPTQRDHNTEHEWSEEEISPGQNCDRDKADSQRPQQHTHGRERRRRQAAQLPREHGQEEEHHCNKQPEANVEVPIRSRDILRLEVNRSHGTDDGIDPPPGINLAETERMPNGKQHQKYRSNSIKNGGFNLTSTLKSRNRAIAGRSYAYTGGPETEALAPPNLASQLQLAVRVA